MAWKLGLSDLLLITNEVWEWRSYQLYFLTTTSGIYQQYINPFFLASLSALAASKLMWTLSDSKTDVNNFSRVLKLIAQVFWHEIICQSCHCCSTPFQRPVYQFISSCWGIGVGWVCLTLWQFTRCYPSMQCLEIDCAGVLRHSFMPSSVNHIT